MKSELDAKTERLEAAEAEVRELRQSRVTEREHRELATLADERKRDKIQAMSMLERRSRELMTERTRTLKLEAELQKRYKTHDDVRRSRPAMTAQIC